MYLIVIIVIAINVVQSTIYLRCNHHSHPVAAPSSHDPQSRTQRRDSAPSGRQCRHLRAGRSRFPATEARGNYRKGSREAPGQRPPGNPSRTGPRYTSPRACAAKSDSLPKSDESMRPIALAADPTALGRAATLPVTRSRDFSEAFVSPSGEETEGREDWTSGLTLAGDEDASGVRLFG